MTGLAPLRTLHRSFGRRVGRVAPDWLVARYREWTTDIYVVSFPKSGRTWLRTILGHVLEARFGATPLDPTSVHHMWQFDRRIPRIVFTHDMDAHLHRADAIQWSGRKYRGRRTIVLIRDPRDTIVSLYFEMTKRVHAYTGTIADFIRQEEGGIASLIAFLNLWMANLDRLPRKLVIRYEDLHARPVETIEALLDFVGVEGVDRAVVFGALERSSFGAMRAMEAAGAVPHVRLRPGDPADPQSFKVRSGKVGGYRAHLSPADCRYLDDQIEAKLTDSLAIYKAGATQAT
jgi:hypothetical protein